MWYEVQKLRKKGLNKTQISQQTGLDRCTVRKYLKMEEKEFHNWISTPRNLPLKLSKYKSFVKRELEQCPNLSAAQIEDRLKENFSNLPSIHSKTVYNFVQTVRKQYDIAKQKQANRVFEKLPESAYGEQAQVDFGETWLQSTEGKRKKVYFFAIVLSRSRYKYVYFSNHPFTSASAIEGHELSFEYFEGIPRKIIYDQDSVFLRDENLGDYLLSETFKSYCNTQDFEVVFCRKADPQSKGKVENVVKYIKQNFLRGRKYTNIDTLNKQAIAWLERTGNAKKHSSTQKIPKEEWLLEKEHLLPVKTGQKKEKILKRYKVLKDNTISYKSNYYSLPAGTYKDKQTSVFLEAKEGELYLYSSEKELIAKHKISIDRGKYIRNTDHSRKKSETTEKMRNQVFEILGKSELAEIFLELLHKKKSRYFRDNLHYLIKNNKNYSQQIINDSLSLCIENKQFNANVLLQMMNKKHIEANQETEANSILKQLSETETSNEPPSFEISKSDINHYENIF